MRRAVLQACLRRGKPKGDQNSGHDTNEKQSHAIPLLGNAWDCLMCVVAGVLIALPVETQFTGELQGCGQPDVAVEVYPKRRWRGVRDDIESNEVWIGQVPICQIFRSACQPFVRPRDAEPAASATCRRIPDPVGLGIRWKIRRPHPACLKRAIRIQLGASDGHHLRSRQQNEFAFLSLMKEGDDAYVVTVKTCIIVTTIETRSLL